MFIKTTLSIILIALVILSCDKNKDDTEPTCDYSDPIEDLPWLNEVKNELTDCTCEMSIIQARFTNQTVFYTAMTDPLCDGIYTITLFDCEGNNVKIFNETNFSEYPKEVSEIEVLYRCEATQ